MWLELQHSHCSRDTQRKIAMHPHRHQEKSFVSRLCALAAPGVSTGVMNALSAAEREASYYLRRAADHRREAQIARAEGDEVVAAIFDVGARNAERVAKQFRGSLRNVWPPGSIREKVKCP
jgi:hypothetical protein